MELLEAIQTRHSVRAFKSTPVPDDVIHQILKAASNSPSYMNTQPWEVAVVTGTKRDELSRQLYELASSGVEPHPDIPLPKGWPPGLAQRAKSHNMKRLQLLGIRPDDEPKKRELLLANFKFYGAPCVLFLFMDKTLGSWSILDMGIFTQSILLAAHACGLGACPQATLTWYPDTVRKFLGIPESKLLVLGISIGYPDREAKINTYRSEKINPSNFVRWYT